MTVIQNAKKTGRKDKFLLSLIAIFQVLELQTLKRA
jgi:hypothetical protein